MRILRNEDGELTLFAMVLFIGTLVGLFIFALTSFTSVGAGEVGVRFNRLSGGIQEDQFDEGWHIKPPWVAVYKMNVKTQAYTMSKTVGEGVGDYAMIDDSLQCLTMEGQPVDIDVTLNYRLDYQWAWWVRKTVGPDGSYQAIIVRGITREAVRDVIARYKLQGLYDVSRSKIASEMTDELKRNLDEYHIVVEALRLRNIDPPDSLKTAITAKLETEQAVQKKQFELDWEKLEAQRKAIEAQGIADANRIISESLTDKYLWWYWIKMLEGAEKQVIYIPIGNGWPMLNLPVGESPIPS